MSSEQEKGGGEPTRAELVEALRWVVKFANELYDHWNMDRDAKVGKYIVALCGSLPKYRKDVDEFHALLEKTKNIFPEAS